MGPADLSHLIGILIWVTLSNLFYSVVVHPNYFYVAEIGYTKKLGIRVALKRFNCYFTLDL